MQLVLGPEQLVDWQTVDYISCMWTGQEDQATCALNKIFLDVSEVKVLHMHTARNGIL